MIYFLSIIVLLIAFFFVFNSIIWLKNKRMKNVNDIIVKVIIYVNFVIIIGLLLFISYLYYYNLNIIISK